MDYYSIIDCATILALKRILLFVTFVNLNRDLDIRIVLIFVRSRTAEGVGDDDLAPNPGQIIDEIFLCVLGIYKDRGSMPVVYTA